MYEGNNLADVNNNSNNFTGPNQNVPYRTENSNKKSGVVIGIVVCAVCAVIGLGLGIYNIIKVAQVEQNLNLMISNFYTDDDADGSQDLGCVQPETADEISYLVMGYNKGNDQVFVDAEGEISYYSDGLSTNGNDSSTEQTIKTDTTGVMQQIISNGPENYSDMQDSEGWDYVVEVETNDGHVCQAGGQGAAPAWFNSLVELVNSKK